MQIDKKLNKFNKLQISVNSNFSKVEKSTPNRGNKTTENNKKPVRKSAGLRVCLKLWRRGWDSNPRYPSGYTPLAGERLRPLGHLSGKGAIAGNNQEFKHFTRKVQKNMHHQQRIVKKQPNSDSFMRLLSLLIYTPWITLALFQRIKVRNQ